MITFYPGPSKIYPQVAVYLQDAVSDGILSQNHRSMPFMELLKDCTAHFKRQQNIPEDYEIYFTSSATECWEIISQSLVEDYSHHFFNGSFGEKWFDYSTRLGKKTSASRFGLQEKVPKKQFSDADVCCFTQNETSNGTQIEHLSFDKSNSEVLIAVDVTSSLGGIEIDWNLADIWFASLQKCLGLPAGMGVMVCSPKTMKRAEKINDYKYYNSLLFIRDNFRKYQTHYTPNVLAIYLLWRLIKQMPDTHIISKNTKARANDFYTFIEHQTSLDLLIKNSEVRSDTVITIEGTDNQIFSLKQKAKKNNIILGDGYGAWKHTTCRIANFPAIENIEFDELKSILA